ncbi:Serine/threonine-protein phosphatase 2A 65 kDa regulatory subunit A [Carpediemonas membranifera]|uniref:Serine/threonine-protein phosphatase 2A 65 kDa regulatory subunit A n=1 Tax=Carpediemonas membranifera TaxID=201153 RepID=A0A8J6ASR9_9EUKA|nr:Serine/threonine-protein phosphatase 2A 65 kDa regulatory subunit A [Carpediemonas membranifera]|eukprot:KAG9393571.1 Serine/threonine-protein phosphatase 2A 65 kDa regulatory subunit A [Carpediemonas membranifera]
MDVDEIITVNEETPRDTNEDLLDILTITDIGPVVAEKGMQYCIDNILPEVSTYLSGFEWRPRAKMIRLFPSLVEHLAEESMFSGDVVAALFSVWLSDPVQAVRAAASETVAVITGKFGQDWGAASLSPQLQGLSKSDVSRFRVAAVDALESLISFFDDYHTERYALPVLLSLVADPVPNVRINVAHALNAVAVGHRSLRDKVRAAIETLYTDPDLDVKEVAEVALKQC